MPDPREIDLQRAHEALARKAWLDAYTSFARADAAEGLEPDDLERMAMCAAMAGRDDAAIGTNERLHALLLERGERGRAGRAAFWAAFRLLSLGEVGRAGGWFARVERLAGEDDPLRGWLLIPEVYRGQRGGDLDRAFDRAGEAAAIGQRHGDRDLEAFARTQQGATRLRQGRVREGLALLDEAMLTATGADLHPVVTGLVYCTTIASCARVYALDRAREWTALLSRWCEAQPQLNTFNGICLVHRSEILELDGSWREAIAEAGRVSVNDPAAAAGGCYQRGEIHRLLGEHGKAEEAYQHASRAGRDPQPGLALLRLAQGRTEAAMRAIDRAVQGTADRLQRTRLLPAQVEIRLAAGNLEGATAAAAELRDVASGMEAPVLGAMADHAEGAVLLARGEPARALPFLRRSLELWQELSAPYLAARVRVLAGQACRALGDEDGARLELDAARAVFQKLGAATDLARLAGPPREGGRLTPRELEVLRHVAAGETNPAIARRLGLSEKTVDRHLSNILHKLDVTSRAAATAQALRLGLL